jgi:hypothetical protein
MAEVPCQDSDCACRLELSISGLLWFVSADLPGAASSLLVSVLQLKQVVAETAALKERQETPDPPEALTCIPSLQVGDRQRARSTGCSAVLPLSHMLGRGMFVMRGTLLWALAAAASFPRCASAKCNNDCIYMPLHGCSMDVMACIVQSSSCRPHIPTGFCPRCTTSTQNAAAV